MNRRFRRLVLTWLTVVATTSLAQAFAQDPGAPRRKVEKTDTEWSRLLTHDQYLVTRRKATEPAFSGKYATSHVKGTFACVGCGAELFSSRAKFDSGTGWPSFYEPADPKRVETAADHLLAESRIEVLCRDCGAHLGHVFDDGPPPTGLRYCINSLALKLIPAAAAPAKAKTKPARSPAAPAAAQTRANTPTKAQRKNSPAADLINGTPAQP